MNSLYPLRKPLFFRPLPQLLKIRLVIIKSNNIPRAQTRQLQSLHACPAADIQDGRPFGKVCEHTEGLLRCLRTTGPQPWNFAENLMNHFHIHGNLLFLFETNISYYTRHQYLRNFFSSL